MSIPRILVLVLVPVLAAAQGVGYDDTPQLPGQQWKVHDKARPNPPVVKPGPFSALPRPKDAIVLFDGTDLSKWTGRGGKASLAVEAAEAALLPEQAEDVFEAENFRLDGIETGPRPGRIGMGEADGGIRPHGHAPPAVKRGRGG